MAEATLTKGNIKQSKKRDKLYAPQIPSPLEGLPHVIAVNPLFDRTKYVWDSRGIRRLFADAFINVCKYVPERKGWHTYDGKIWVYDSGNIAVQKYAMDLIDHLMDYRKYLTDENERKMWVEFVYKHMGRKAREAFIMDAASEGMEISINEFDKNYWILNCENCTIDLKSRKMWQHRPEDMLTMVTKVSFAKGAKCERWERFMTEVMLGHDEKIGFLQRSLGYALTGDISYDCLFMLLGLKTRNGKGTTMETIKHMLGDYAANMQPDTLAQKQFASGGAPSEDIARLRGKRLVVVPEPEKGMRLNSAIVKQLTGGDTVTARKLNENSFEYRPQFKLFIHTNHKPIVKDDSLFASGRVKLITFERHFEESERDIGLREYFRQPANLSGILNWCIDGLRTLGKEGLKQPTAVVEATNEYREESNPIGQFIGECLVSVTGAKTLYKSVFAEYEKWCDAWGFGALNSRNLAAELRTKGVVIKAADKNQLYVFGYGIATDSVQGELDDCPF